MATYRVQSLKFSSREIMEQSVWLVKRWMHAHEC